jgi:hypothetical protein
VLERRAGAIAGVLALLLLALSVAVVASGLGPPPHRPRQVKELDHYRYIALAEAPPLRPEDPRARERPFVHRVLVPALVWSLTRVSGISVHTGFWLTTLLALCGWLFVLFLWLRGAGFDDRTALVGVALAGLVPGAARWYAYQYWMCDPLCLLLVGLGLLSARQGRRSALGAVSVAGVLTRESYVLVPVWATLRWVREQGARRGLSRAAATFAAAAAAWLAVRLAAPVEGGPSLLEAAGESLAFRARHLFGNQWYFATLGSFGVLVPLLLLRLRHAPAALKGRAEDAALLLLVYGSLALANNTDRLLAYALPVLLPPALRALGELSRVWGRGPAAAAALLGQAWFYAATPAWGEPGLSLYQPVRWSVVVLCALLWAAGAAGLRRASYSS